MRVLPYRDIVERNSCFYQINSRNFVRNDATKLRKPPFNLTTHFFILEKHILRFLQKTFELFEKRKEQTIFLFVFCEKRWGKCIFQIISTINTC